MDIDLDVYILKLGSLWKEDVFNDFFATKPRHPEKKCNLRIMEIDLNFEAV